MSLPIVSWFGIILKQETIDYILIFHNHKSSECFPFVMSYFIVVLRSELDISSMIVTLLHDKSLGKEMSMKQQRRHFSAQQKVQMLRQHLVEKAPLYAASWTALAAISCIGRFVSK